MRYLPLTALLFSSVTFGQMFSKISSKTSGIDFYNQITETQEINSITYPYLYNGGGVAIGDINNDGLEDIYFTGNQVKDKLFLNQGDLKFKDVTDKYFKRESFGFHTGVTMVDINNDGWLDICVSAAGPSTNPEDRRNRLFINQNGKGFIDKASEYGLDDTLNTTQTIFFDADLDGDLDAFVLNHSYSRFGMHKSLKKDNRFIAGKDKLMINENGKFEDKSAIFGIFSEGFGNGVVVSDLNNDNIPDIYISSDFGYPNLFYAGTGRNRYKLISSYSFRRSSENGFGTDAADINNDGWMDIFSVDLANETNSRTNETLGNLESDYYKNLATKIAGDQYVSNSLQLNINGTFVEISNLAGVSSSDWSWGTVMADFNLDGYQDIYIATGCPKDIRDKYFREGFINEFYHSGDTSMFREILKTIPEQKLQDFLFFNNKDLTFTDVSSTQGIDHKVNVSSVAYGDLDNDGDLDLVCNGQNDLSFVMENTLISSNHYLKVKLIGPGTNIGANGAKVRLYVDEIALHREANVTRGFQSSVSPIIHFGLPFDTKIDSLVIIWNSKEKSVLKKINLDKQITVDYNTEEKIQIQQKLMYNLPFERTKVQGMKLMDHIENDIEVDEGDNNIQERLSKLGPCLEVADFNGDGRDDFFLGAAKGSNSCLFIQNEEMGFDKSESSVWKGTDKFEDVGSCTIDADNDGDLDLYVVSGGNEANVNDPALSDRLYINNGKGRFSLSKDVIPENRESGQKVIAEDLNNDGWTDLIVFGRQMPGSYPNLPNSRILINEKGTFLDKTNSLAPEFKKLGMVTDAICMDIDRDDDKDFVIVGEWMPVTIFLNDDGVFKNKTKDFGLEKSRGWWNSIDFISDKGTSKTFILGNVGTNTPFKASEKSPYSLELKNVLNANGSYQADVFANSYLTLYESKSTLVPMPNFYQAGPINTTILYDFTGDKNPEIICAGNNFELKNNNFKADGNSIWMNSLGDLEDPISLKENLNIRSGEVILIGGQPHLLFGVNNSMVALFKYELK